MTLHQTGTRDVRLDRLGHPAPKRVRNAGVEVPKVRDARSAAQREADQALRGTWHRCPTHGPTQGTIWVGAVPYCPEPGCSEAVFLVHSASQDPVEKPSWNSFNAPIKTTPRPKAKPPKEEPVSTPTDRRTVAEILLEHLGRTGPCRTGELRRVVLEELGEKAAAWGAISSALSRMEKRGDVTSPERGLWGINGATVHERASAPVVEPAPEPEVVDEDLVEEIEELETEDADDDLVDEIPETRLFIESDGQTYLEVIVRTEDHELRRRVIQAALANGTGV